MAVPAGHGPAEWTHPLLVNEPPIPVGSPRLICIELTVELTYTLVPRPTWKLRTTGVGLYSEVIVFAGRFRVGSLSRPCGWAISLHLSMEWIQKIFKARFHSTVKMGGQ